MIVFGGSGDLTRRKPMPALYHLEHEDLLFADGCIIAASRTEMSDDQFRGMTHEACFSSIRISRLLGEAVLAWHWLRQISIA